jgi:periplasmic protein TonB
MAVYYPPRARKARIDGVVVVACIARADSRFEACRIVREMPQGFGFGDATLKMVAEIGQADLKVNKPGDEVQATIRWHYSPELPPG